MLSFSIITCVHNPDPEIFVRLIRAISELKTPEGSSAEWVVVDNNSKRKVEREFDFSAVSMSVCHVVESKPGLTSARVAGMKNAKYEWLVFFDDDNEPAADYLIKLSEGIKNFPQVSAWGPGRIEVEYLGKVKPWFIKNKQFFQDRDVETQFGNEPQWQSYYPQGTGLCFQRSALDGYLRQVEDGSYSVSDRTGKSLISGGDTQMVLDNQKNGRAAGVLQGLVVKHLIENRKATIKYLSRQKFWTAASYHLVLKQVYPEVDLFEGKNISFTGSDMVQLIRKFYNEIKVKKNDWKTAYLNLCGYLGEMYAPYVALNQKPGRKLRTMMKLLIR